MKEIKTLLSLLGLRGEESQIYLLTLQNGASSVLEISRGTGVNRMSVYRFCEGLSDQGFLRRLAELKTTKYEAAPVSFLKTKIEKFESKLSQIKETYKSAHREIEELLSYSQSKTKVIHYVGSEKVKQLIWNSLDAESEVLSFGYRTLKEAFGINFIEKWWSEMVHKGIVNKILMNPETLEIKNAASSEMDGNPVKNLYVWKPRIVQNTILEIKEETFLYNDVYAIVQWEGSNVFGVEIYNNVIAEQERGIFEVLWKLGKEVKR